MSSAKPGLRKLETSLYAAVKRHLEARGYEAKGEICGCDIVGIRPGEPTIVVITELKLALSLELILQGVDRLTASDEVWLAVLATRRGRDRDRRAHKLCRLLGFGLLAVDPARQAVEILAEPALYRPRPNGKRRSQLVQEHQRRQGDPAMGGSSRTPILTAYRQRALACALGMAEGPVNTQALRRIVPDAGTMMLRNVYGWFERESRGVYRLTEAGATALGGALADRSGTELHRHAGD